MSHQEIFWVLFSKKLSGESTPAELAELEKLITDHPEWQYAIQNLEDLWKHRSPADDNTAEDAYLLHLHRMKERQVPFGHRPEQTPAAGFRTGRRKWYWAAAVLLLGLSGVWLARSIQGNHTMSRPLAGETNEIRTQRGSKSTIQLPDGTTVLLNAGSKLTYTKDFGKSLREVHLEGEGYFDVKENRKMPFVIHTSDIDIRVLGTVFNVKAYPDDKKTETSLIRGSIEVTIRNRPNDKIILSPSEKLVVENKVAGLRQLAIHPEQAGPVPVDPVPVIAVNKLTYNPADSSVAETGWTENKLVFRDESFADLATSMERWYDVQIAFRNAMIAETRFTGIFENETIEQALEALKISVPFLYEKKGKQIIIN